MTFRKKYSLLILTNIQKEIKINNNKIEALKKSNFISNSYIVM